MGMFQRSPVYPLMARKKKDRQKRASCPLSSELTSFHWVLLLRFLYFPKAL
jgi:hypothetical protein